MSYDDREMLIHMQHFTASVITLLNTLKTIDRSIENLNAKELKTKERLFKAVDKFMIGLKNQTEDFDYSKFIKKVFYSLRSVEALRMLKEKDSSLFSMRDENNRIVTILPGIDIRFAMKYFDEQEKKDFWPNFYLFVSSTFAIIRMTNPDRMIDCVEMDETIQIMKLEIAQTGVMFGKQIFNPFIGVTNENERLTVDQMFTANGIKPVDASSAGSMESMLNMMGVENLISTDNLKKQLENLGAEHVDEATSKIVEMLGAQDNEDVKEVCGTLIKDIVENLKTNGIQNIGSTLMDIANKTKGKINMEKMKQTASSMQYFMNNSTEKMKEMKDENGNPIGENLMNTLSSYMGMMNQMNPQDTKRATKN